MSDTQLPEHLREHLSTVSPEQIELYLCYAALGLTMLVRDTTVMEDLDLGGKYGVVMFDTGKYITFVQTNEMADEQQMMTEAIAQLLHDKDNSALANLDKSSAAVGTPDFIAFMNRVMGDDDE